MAEFPTTSSEIHVLGMFLMTTRTQRLEVTEFVTTTIGFWNDVVNIEPDIIDPGAPESTHLTRIAVALQNLLSPCLPIWGVLLARVRIVLRRILRTPTCHQHRRHQRC